MYKFITMLTSILHLPKYIFALTWLNQGFLDSLLQLLGLLKNVMMTFSYEIKLFINVMTWMFKNAFLCSIVFFISLHFEILIWTSNYFYEEVIVKMEINFQFFHHCSFSMRIWLGNTEELLNTSEVDCTPFFLLKEVALIFGSSFFLHIFYITE